MRLRVLKKVAFILGLACEIIFTTHANAQTPADAGALQHQIERDRQGILPPRVAPVRPAVPRELKPVTGIFVKVEAFKFAGNTRLSDKQLAQVVAPYLARPLDFAQLQAATAAVGEAYRTAGWVVNAYLPEQDIRDGVVTIQIVEAVFAGLKIEGYAGRIQATRLLKGVEVQQALGQPLQANALDRALLLADDLPGVAVSGALRAGAREGETELIYKIADEPLVVGDIRADNTGARSTGASQVLTNLLLSSPAGYGDQVSASLLVSEGSRYGRLGYTVPVGYDGWQIGANTSHLSYDLIGANGKGTSQAVGVEARYPIIRARQQNLYLSLNADHKSFDNQFNGATTTQYGMNVSSMGLSGNYFDDQWGGGSNSMNLAWVTGHRNNQVGTTDAGFGKLRYALSRQQVITSTLSFYAGIEGQASEYTLDTSESFYLGGANGVRAYPTNEGRGSGGELAKLELRWRAIDKIVLTGFYDHGRVRNHDSTADYSLKGAGLAASWQVAPDLGLNATWAHRIGTNPGASSTGNDSDGSLTKNPYWLSASFVF